MFEYLEADRSDWVILGVDDRARGYLGEAAAIVFARAHHQYEEQARNSMCTESARGMSGCAAALLGAWLDTPRARRSRPGGADRAGRQPSSR